MTMELLLRYKLTSPDDKKIYTMDEHLKILKQYNEVYWGQFSKKTNLISSQKIAELLNGSGRVIFINGQNEEVYLAYCSDFIPQSDSRKHEIDINKIPAYYREKINETYSEDADNSNKVSVWLKLSALEKVEQGWQYLEQIVLNSTKKSIVDSLAGQSAHFFVDDHNPAIIPALIDVQRDALQQYQPSAEDERKFRAVQVADRQGQPKFRNELMNIYNGKCCITGCDVTAVLQAAHVTAFNGEGSHALENGMLLRADIHYLWDRFLIAIHPKTKKLEIASQLKGTEYEQYEGKCIFEGMANKRIPTEKLLKIQYDSFKKK